MKKLSFLYLFIVSAILFSCDNDDEGFYNAIYFKSVENLIHIEHQPSYTVGDYLWIRAENFNRFLEEPNQTTPLDLFQTTKATAFEFIYGLEKKEGNNWNLVPIGTTVQVDEGSVETGSYLLAKCIYDATAQQYLLRAGIALNTPGEYRMFFGSSYLGSTKFDITSVNTDPSATYVTISTTAENSASDGFYYFTVN